MKYLIIITTLEGRFYYSPTQGLVKEKWRALKLDRDAVEVAVRLLSRSKSEQRRNWFVQWKPEHTQPAELPTFDYPSSAVE